MIKPMLIGWALHVGALWSACGVTAVRVNGRDEVTNLTSGLYNQPQPGNERWLPVATLVKRKCRN